jgi:hypothetical protein
MNILAWSREALRRMTILDLSILKICLLMIGMLLGALLSSFVKEQIWWFIGIASATYLWLMLRFFRPDRKKKK